MLYLASKVTHIDAQQGTCQGLYPSGLVLHCPRTVTPNGRSPKEDWWGGTLFKITYI